MAFTRTSEEEKNCVGITHFRVSEPAEFWYGLLSAEQKVTEP